MSELQQKKDYIMTFIKENINKKKFNKNKVCKEKTYEEIINNTKDFINNLDEEEIEFNIMLIKYIKEDKIAMVDPEYFRESKLECFLYNKDVLTIINMD